MTSADIVIESSRPRALEQLGLRPETVLDNDGPRLWISITGHGRDAGRNRVAFGDDASVAGGLVSWAGPTPTFCGDAIADPLAGLAATAAALTSLAEGGRWLVEVAMAEVAADLAGATLAVGPTLTAARPQPPAGRGRGPALGAHTAQVLGELST